MHTHHTRNSGFSLPALLIGLLSLVAGAWLAQSLLNRAPPAPELTSATRLEPARVIQDFALIDHRQQPFTLAQLQGRWTFMFFGYTHCPDICPTTLTTLSAVARKIAALPNAPAAPQYAFVSIDPERDTVDVLAKYVPYFNPDFIGVTGAADAIEALTKQLSVLYLKMDAQAGSESGYLMDHSAAILLLDPQGRLHALMSPPFDPAQMATDYQKITQYYEALQ